jgi:hypothetical protein
VSPQYFGGFGGFLLLELAMLFSRVKNVGGWY